MSLDLCKQTEFLQVLHNLLPCLVPVQSGVPACILVHDCPVVHDPYLLKAMAQADFKVVGIVGRGYLHDASPEFLIHVRVCDDRYLPVHQRQYDRLAYQVFVPLIFRVDCDCRIAEHCLRPGRSYRHEPVAVLYRVLYVPETAFLFLVFHFRIRYGCTALGTPVDYAVAPVDEAFFIKPDENLEHGLRKALVHREPFPFPIARAAQLLELLHYPAAIDPFPFPGPFKEFFPAYVFLFQALFCHGLDDPRLSGYAGMVRARQPQRAVALHPFPPDQYVLQCIVEGMPHVKLSGDVRRRYHYGERRLAVVRLRMEITLFRPFFIKPVLHL